MTPQELRRERQRYAEDVLARYCQTPGTLGQVRREDRRLARWLWDRNVPLAMVDAAFILAVARRTFRPPNAPPLDPIRSLHYYADSRLMPAGDSLARSWAQHSRAGMTAAATLVGIIRGS